MKAVPALTTEPTCLAAWTAEHPEELEATGRTAKDAWNRFRNSEGAYAEVRDALVARQQGLCGYCEQRLTTKDGALVVGDYQVEHVLAKSSGSGRVLDWRNMMLCCGGGTWPHRKDEPTRYLPGKDIAANLCCGQAKGDAEIDGACDPRRFDWREPLVEVGLDGHMRASEPACHRARIDPGRLEQTIAMLGLNCERLKRARRSIADHIRLWVVQLWQEGRSASAHLTESEAVAILRMYIGGRLRPDAHGHLQPFWTTERQYLGEPAEAWIADNASTLHFE